MSAVTFRRCPREIGELFRVVWMYARFDDAAAVGRASSGSVRARLRPDVAATAPAVGAPVRLLDADAAIRKAATRLTGAFGSRVIPVRFPPGVKDPADLAPLADGNSLFRAAIRQAVDRHVGQAPTPII